MFMFIRREKIESLFDELSPLQPNTRHLKKTASGHVPSSGRYVMYGHIYCTEI